MKKILSLSAAMLLCFLAHSQEAENLGSYAEVSIIPRLDLSPYYSSEDSKLGFTHGNSSIYTLFEGKAGEHFSWTIANHWLSSLNEPASEDFNYGWPYSNLGYSSCTNWLDYFKAELTFGNWTISLGKDNITTLGFEYEDWDWDTHFDFSSPLWANLPGYQWGGKLAYTIADNTTFSAQMTTSPYGEHPFSSGLWTYSFQWRGEYNWFEPIWSYTALQESKEAHAYQHVVTFGNRFNFSDKLNLTLDWTSSFAGDGLEEKCDLNHFNQIRGALKFVPSERWDFSFIGYYSKGFEAAALGCFGALAQFYPLKDSQDLRIHGMLSFAPGAYQLLALTVGATYNIRIRCW